LQPTTTMLEEGELHDDNDGYHPEYEWPGDSRSEEPTYSISDRTLEPSHTPPLKRRPAPILRLLVTATSILSAHQIVAILDGYSQVQFGRDHPPPGSHDLRIRLKEMSVSKVHACVYFDETDNWAIVDMGSMHGTFLKGVSDPTTSSRGSSVGIRLSLPRVASVPRILKHLDEITIGSTTFLVHIHSDALPCAKCSPKGPGDEIPLFSPSHKRRDKSISRQETLTDTPALTLEKDPKKALSALKRALLTRRTQEPTPTGQAKRYLDRSARRRTLHPTLHPDSPGVQSTASTPRSHSPVKPLESLVPLAPKRPLPPSNVGHRILLKQGWRPGTSLGLPDSETSTADGLTEPLEVSGTKGRAGLGMHADSELMKDWRAEAKRRRWASAMTE
jgi:hypothetical protein